jgi:hypothetical protein
LMLLLVKMIGGFILELAKLLAGKLKKCYF